LPSAEGGPPRRKGVQRMGPGSHAKAPANTSTAQGMYKAQQEKDATSFENTERAKCTIRGQVFEHIIVETRLGQRNTFPDEMWMCPASLNRAEARRGFSMTCHPVTGFL
jgi:hypothetical protein